MPAPRGKFGIRLTILPRGALIGPSGVRASRRLPRRQRADEPLCVLDPARLRSPFPRSDLVRFQKWQSLVLALLLLLLVAPLALAQPNNPPVNPEDQNTAVIGGLGATACI